ncbi:MAG: PIN domain-containing protein [Methanobacteriota archaeon]
MEKIDANDVVFIAAALTAANAVIWSDDKSELIKHRKRRKS